MKKIWLLVGIVLLIFTGYEIAISYAKYVSQAQGVAEEGAGAWAITVNDEDIVTGNTQKTFVIDQLTYLPNQYVADNVMAPASVGFFDITINPSGSSVAIRFDINIDSTGLGINDAIYIDSAFKIVNGVEVQNSMTKTTADTYTGTMSLSDVNLNQTTTIRVYVKWEETGENDEDDTLIGDLKNVNLDLPIVITVSQYMGEQIVEYQ